MEIFHILPVSLASGLRYYEKVLKYLHDFYTIAKYLKANTAKKETVAVTQMFSGVSGGSSQDGELMPVMQRY